MGDDRIGVSEASSDVLGLELRAVFAQGVFGHALREQSQYQLDGDSHIPNDRLTAEHVRSARDSVEKG